MDPWAIISTRRVMASGFRLSRDTPGQDGRWARGGGVSSHGPPCAEPSCVFPPADSELCAEHQRDQPEPGSQGYRWAGDPADRDGQPDDVNELEMGKEKPGLYVQTGFFLGAGDYLVVLVACSGSVGSALVNRKAIFPSSIVRMSTVSPRLVACALST